MAGMGAGAAPPHFQFHHEYSNPPPLYRHEYTNNNNNNNNLHYYPSPPPSVSAPPHYMPPLQPFAPPPPFPPPYNNGSSQRHNRHQEASNSSIHKERVRTLFISGLPEDVKPREIFNLFRRRSGFQTCQLKYTGHGYQIVAFAVFSHQEYALDAKDALN
ncbi:hypothetical protein KI387_011794, partial [Taxus chinensis]